MADSPDKRGEPDRSLINMNQPHEVGYWKTKFGCTKERLQQAVDAVGNSAAKVEQWLKQNK